MWQGRGARLAARPREACCGQTARPGQSAWPRRPTPGWSLAARTLGSCRAARRARAGAGDPKARAAPAGRTDAPPETAPSGCRAGSNTSLRSRRARRRRCGRCARRPPWPRRAQRSTDGTGRARPAPRTESSAGARLPPRRASRSAAGASTHEKGGGSQTGPTKRTSRSRTG